MRIRSNPFCTVIIRIYKHKLILTSAYHSFASQLISIQFVAQYFFFLFLRFLLGEYSIFSTIIPPSAIYLALRENLVSDLTALGIHQFFLLFSQFSWYFLYIFSVSRCSLCILHNPSLPADMPFVAITAIFSDNKFLC